jgi:hypothetical protein
MEDFNSHHTEEEPALSLIERRKVDSVLALLEPLSERMVEGESVSKEMKKIIDSLPKELRAVAQKRLAALVQQVRADFGVEGEATMSTQQREMLHTLKQLESPFIAERVSRASLRKIRMMLLQHTHIMEVLVQMGERLRVRGVAGIEGKGGEVVTPTLPSAAPPKQDDIKR